MSAELYAQRIYHDGCKPGIVRVDGIQRHVNECPQIPGLPRIVAIDVAPLTCTWIITPQFGPRRELESHEVKKVNQWLWAIKEGKA
jgi:hypothetical protein